MIKPLPIYNCSNLTRSPHQKYAKMCWEIIQNFVDQLQKLNDLYKSGVLTKEEFEKAKSKLLNT